MPEENEGRNRGYAVVQFESPQEAYNAIGERRGGMLTHLCIHVGHLTWDYMVSFCSLIPWTNVVRPSHGRTNGQF